jgi:hypothetical protein
MIWGCAVHTLPPIQTDLGPALFGNWEWRQSTGGIAGRTETPTTRKYREKLVLQSSGFYEVIRDDSLAAKGQFSIRREATQLRADSTYVIRWEGLLPLHSTIVELQGADTLRLTDLCVDCYEHLYVRTPR